MGASSSSESKLKNLKLECHINEIMSETEVTLYFENTTKNPIELLVLIPEISNCVLTRFEMTLDKKKVVSKILEKEKAKNKYSDAIASGNMGLVSYEKNKEINVSLGNIPIGKTIEFKVFYFGKIIYMDCSYKASFPTIFPKFVINEQESKPYIYEYKKQTVEGNIYINALSKLMRLVIKGSSNFNKIKKKYSGSRDSAIISILKNTFSWKDIPGIILFRTEKMYEPKLYSQFDPLRGQTYYFSKNVIEKPEFNNLPKKDKIDEKENLNYNSLLIKKDVECKSNIGCYIFLIDQSGSMSGRSIKLCSEALLLFLQSLYKGSYFQLIGFGSDFEYYSEEPLEYNKKNVKKFVNIIKGLSANKGGTKLYEPLKSIYKNDIYKKINLCKHIFLLTDGEILNKEQTLNLIGSYSNEFTLHSIGITDCDKDLIERCAIMGNGYFYYIPDLNDLNKNIISSLENSQIANKLKCIVEIDKKPLIELNNNKIIGMNDILNHGFILKDKNIEDINMKMKFQKGTEEKEIDINWNKNNILILPEGDNLGKIIIENYLKQFQNIEFETTIKLSKDFNILTPNTAFFAEMENEEIINNKMITSKYEKYNNYNSDLYYWANHSRVCEGINEEDIVFGCYIESSDIVEKEGVCEGEAIENNFNDIIMSQDIFEGNWTYNEQIRMLIQKEKKMYNKIEELSKKKNIENNDAIITLFILFYIYNKEKEKTEELKFIINKAKTYINKIYSLEYEDIIKGIN